MTSTPATTSLESWFRSHGGYLHPNIRILQASPDSSSGIHYHATSPIPPGTTFAYAPHTLALSYLNALVDDAFPVFAQQRHRFKVEAIGFWYLMAQYVNLERSFWRPYLNTLPAPDSEFTQPLFFEAPGDVAWLERTDVWHTALARKDVYEQYYKNGLTILREAGVDVEPYTWHLFKWAVAVFSSRAFASRALHPEASKCWTTYKSTPTGSRDPVILDMSSVLAEDLVFPVLFPGLDAANHDHNAKVEWTYDTDQFILTLADSGTGIEAGNEVFNNYGPKGNGELLLGYGFCIPNNPHDTVAMTLKQPSQSLQRELKATHPNYFTENGIWSAEKSTVYLKHPPSQLENPHEIFHHLPEALLELLLYVLLDERKQLTLYTSINQPLHYLTSPASPSRKHSPHIARMILSSLSNKLQTLRTNTPSKDPRNAKQVQAAIYRAGQVTILTSLTSALQNYIHSLIWTFNPQCPAQQPSSHCLQNLETFHALLTHHCIISAEFLTGVEANTNSSDLSALCKAGWEEDLLVLLVFYAMLSPNLDDIRHEWLNVALRDYLNQSHSETDLTGQADGAEGENAQDLLEFVRTAAEVCGRGSVWADERWSVPLIAAVGRLALGRDGFQVMVDDGEGGRALRTCVCLYFGTQEERTNEEEGN